MLTPFDAHDRVDLRAAARLARFLVDEGNDGLVVCGTTGEAPSLEDDEKLALVAAVKAELDGRAAVVAGTGGNNTRRAVELTRRAQDAGADAILAVVPYYNRPTPDGLLAHFGAIAEATTLPVVVYNVPGRTATNIAPATVFELARRHENIAGIKESSGDLAQFAVLLRDRPPGFGVWCGDDYLYLPALALGADGLVSVAAHLCARELREMHGRFRGGDAAGAAAIHLGLSELFAALFATSNPVPVKWAMNELGFELGACRSPLGTLPEALAERLRPALDAYRARAHASVVAR